MIPNKSNINNLFVLQKYFGASNQKAVSCLGSIQISDKACPPSQIYPDREDEMCTSQLINSCHYAEQQMFFVCCS